MDKPEITHVRIGNDGDSIYVEYADGTTALYHHTERGDVVRWRGNEKTFISNPWLNLLAYYETHPMNWQNKANARMMALYQAKREEEARKRLEVVE